MLPQRLEHTEKIGGHFVNLHAKEVFELRQSDEHGNAIGKADDDRYRNETNQSAELEAPHQKQEYA